MTSAIDTFKAAIVASRGGKPLSAIHRVALTNPPAGVAVDDVATFLDGFVGRDLRSYAKWMRDAHADRAALFDTIRARLHGRRPATAEEAKRLADEVRLVRTLPDDILRAFGLSANASPSMAADALEARLQNRDTGRAARRGFGGEEPVKVIACRDRGVA
ncbi:hypothetical protein [Methylocystis suflitae]|uniref:hypothetical protein n=1 Tax=Methylocystis suflitae TaxID=2951405 RepID=UPI00210CC381|nr:hypothetical protein [Methylocystis suflitae]MCQ4189923.1 hypothetical protein [Methylocystis suflitae]